TSPSAALRRARTFASLDPPSRVRNRNRPARATSGERASRKAAQAAREASAARSTAGRPRSPPAGLARSALASPLASATRPSVSSRKRATGAGWNQAPSDGVLPDDALSD